MEKCKSIKENYLNRSSKGKWLFIRNIGIVILKMTGVPILDPHYKVNWWSYGCAVGGINYSISLLYTLWYYADQPMRALQPFVLLGVLIPVSIIRINCESIRIDNYYFLQSLMIYSLTVLSSKIPKFQSLLRFAGERIYTDDKSNGKYHRVVDQSAVQLLKETIKTLSLVSGSLAIFCFFPLYSIIFKNDLQFPLPVILPFTTLDTYNGLFVNVLNQFFICLLGFTGNCGIEIIACILKNTIWASAVPIRYEFDELTNELHELESAECVEIKFRLRNILVQIQDFDR